MGKFINTATGVTFSVDDSKDYRYSGEGFEAVDGSGEPAKKRAPAKKAAAKKAPAKKAAAAASKEPADSGESKPPEGDDESTSDE